MKKNDKTYLNWTRGLNFKHTVLSQEKDFHLFEAYDSGKSIGVVGQDSNPAKAAFMLCARLRNHYYNVLDEKEKTKTPEEKADFLFKVEKETEKPLENDKEEKDAFKNKKNR